MEFGWIGWHNNCLPRNLVILNSEDQLLVRFLPGLIGDLLGQMSSSPCSLQGKTFHQLLQGLIWKNFDEKKEVTNEMLAEQLYGGDANLDFDTISAQITAIEAVILVVYTFFPPSTRH